MEIVHPTLLLNEAVCKQNIARMAQKAQKHSLQFWPHFKTHQSAKVGEWFREYGVEKITVSSLQMARYFHEAGWKRIHVAFPFNVRAIEGVENLAGTCQLSLNVVNVEQIEALASQKSPVDVFMEIDTGYGRTGINPKDTEHLENLISKIHQASNLVFKGFYCHNGHNYHASNTAEILRNHAITQSAFKSLKQTFTEAICVAGDTPGCSLANDFNEIDVMSPGNFAFYDVMQSELGSCYVDQIAVSMLCPVIDKSESKKSVLVHGGGVHFSKDHLVTDNGVIYGRLKSIYQKGQNVASVGNSRLTSLSQEHGILSCSSKDFDSIQIGDLVEIYPVHSCLTAACMGQYQLDDGRRVGMMDGLCTN